MRAIWIPRHGGPEVLEVRESPDPDPRSGQVRIRVQAAGLNFAEMMARQGIYPDAPKPPCVVGYEAAGVVDALGPDVTSPAPGTRVVTLVRFGAHADTVLAPAAQTRPIPDGMSFEEAAAVPVNYITAHHMLMRVAGLRPGSRVLVHMAAGGVGLAALQLCRTVEGVTVFGTSSAAKHDVLRENGCDHPIDYRSLDYAREVLRITSGEGVDVVLDALGGKDWKKGYNLLRPAGMLVAFGFANAAHGERRDLLHMARQALSIPLFNPLSMMGKNRAVAGVNIGHLWHQPWILMEALDTLLRLYEQGKIHPRIDSIFAFEDAAPAHRRMQERKNIGKIVLRP